MMAIVVEVVMGHLLLAKVVEPALVAVPTLAYNICQ